MILSIKVTGNSSDTYSIIFQIFFSDVKDLRSLISFKYFYLYKQTIQTYKVKIMIINDLHLYKISTCTGTAEKVAVA
jgi:hypothetical protein